MIEVSVDPSKFDAEADLINLVTEFLQDFGQLVVTTTPYKTGFFRDSWYATIGDAGAAPGRGDPVGRITAAIAGYQLGDTITYSNAADYGPYVEFGTRYMAPRGTIRAAIDQAPEIMEAVAARNQR